MKDKLKAALKGTKLGKEVNAYRQEQYSLRQWENFCKPITKK